MFVPLQRSVNPAYPSLHKPAARSLLTSDRVPRNSESSCCAFALASAALIFPLARSAFNTEEVRRVRHSATTGGRS